MLIDMIIYYNALQKTNFNFEIQNWRVWAASTYLKHLNLRQCLEIPYLLFFRRPFFNAGPFNAGPNSAGFENKANAY